MLVIELGEIENSNTLLNSKADAMNVQISFALCQHTKVSNFLFLH